jgi:hypothetical protein
MDDSKQGALTVAELEAIWVAAVDPSYSEAFVAAGDGGGYEAYKQGFAQLARVSQAIDTTTQAAYILPWSGQTGEPAAGERHATVGLDFTRASAQQHALHLVAGAMLVGEETTDWGESAGVVVQTGRRYALASDLWIMPGESGPVSQQAAAELVGWGYNNPLPGTIRRIGQPGVGFTHDRATVTVTVLAPAFPTAPPVPSPSRDASAFKPVVALVAANEADMFIPEHVGQYVQLLVGVNAGNVARVVTFIAPTTTPPKGSGVTLEVVSVLLGAITGSFSPNELVQVLNGATPVGYAAFVTSKARAGGQAWVVVTMLSGVLIAPGPAPVVSLVGQQSGATLAGAVVQSDPRWVAEAPPGGGGAGGATWRVLDWAADLGLEVQNPASPTGGRLGTLDALGFERGLPRLSGEQDEPYRQRIWQVADLVTPNAVKRALFRVGPGPWCLREVGSALMPGFFYDRVDAGGDFWDYDVLQFSVFTDPPLPIDPSFFQERVEVRSAAGDVKVAGFAGRLADDNTFTLIRKVGQGTAKQPLVLAPGDVLVGLSSGLVAAIDDSSPYRGIGLPAGKGYHYYLDYAQFRGFFLVGVPRLERGESGFAYDGHPYNAYDLAAPVLTFYDGAAQGAADAAFNERVFQAVDQVRAGGVGFDLYVEDGSCTA